MKDGRLGEIRRDLERYGQTTTWHSAVVRELVAEVERLQRFEAMWEDCRRHRDAAEQRARRYLKIIRQVEGLVVTEEGDPI